MRHQLQITKRVTMACAAMLGLGISVIVWAAPKFAPVGSETTQITQELQDSNNLESFSSVPVTTPVTESEKSNTAQRYSDLIKRAEYERLSGEYAKAGKTLKQALILAQQIGDRSKTALALGALGNVYIALGPEQTAENFLIKAEAMSREQNHPELTATVLIYLGNFYAFQKNFQRAADVYQEAVRQSSQAKNKILTAQARTNAARAAVKSQQIEGAEVLLKQAATSVYQLGESDQKYMMLINLAKSYMEQAGRLSKPSIHRRYAFNLLTDAISAFDRKKNIRATSYALGYLGELYETDSRYQDALDVTQRALFGAQQIDNKYLLFNWLWQKGRLFVALGEIDLALDAYRNAVALLKDLRHQMSIAYEVPGSTFEESVLPAYSQFIDLLLKNADATTNPDDQKTLLVEVQDTIENLKVAEIRDYFRDECVDALQAKQKPLWKASSTALIVYPILLKDRTELLLDFPGGRMKRLPVPVGLTQLTEETRKFRRLLEKKSTNEYRIPAQNLYRWIINPIISQIDPDQIDTLVFVPDGPLLTIPFSALYDGTQHLIEQYAIAITPGIQLTDPQQLASGQINALLGGLSQSVEGFPPLAHVEDELHVIQQLYGGKLLLNQEFNKQQIRQSLNDDRLNVLHIATHSELGRDVDKSFLLTYDGRLSINRLADYVGMFKFRETPLELIVLSACDTAQGDEKAALGLSGIAVRAGARSALGTLWEVDDAAASLLMQEFYRQFKQPNISRAVALQKAQLSLLDDLYYRHPGYWSAFLLINNWL